MNGLYITDCEGPLTKNDNAFELSAHFIPNGDRLFSVLSRYDDVLAYRLKREGYRAGNTLRLIVPFLKAFGASNRDVVTFCRENLVLVPGVGILLEWLGSNVSVYIISTSYEPYVHSFCDLLEFPRERVSSTKLDLDRVQLSPDEVDYVKGLATEVLGLPLIEEAHQELTAKDERSVAVLDRIFETLSQMQSGRLMEAVVPVGGEEKAKIVNSIVAETDCGFHRTIYVGDSITDVEALKLVDREGGLSISFNGNRYAVESAQVAVITEKAEAMKPLVSDFMTDGRSGTLAAVKRRDNLDYPKIFVVGTGGLDSIARESSKMRKSLRGERIGTLG